MITFVTSILALASFWFSLGQMRTAFLRRDAEFRFLLPDALAMFVLVGISLSVACVALIDVGSSTSLGIILFSALSWLVGIWLLSRAAVGNSIKRIAFIISLPCSIVFAGSWMVYARWGMDWLLGSDTVTWRTAVCLGVSAFGLVAIRQLNGWVAAIDESTENPPLVRVCGGQPNRCPEK
jgi:hypothetical protein